MLLMAYFSIFFTEFSETIFDIRALLQIFIRVDKHSSVKPFFTFKIKEIRYCWVSCASLVFSKCFKHYKNVCRSVTSMRSWDFMHVLQWVLCISFMVTFNLKGNFNLNYKSNTDCDSISPWELWFRGVISNSFAWFSVLNVAYCYWVSGIHSLSGITNRTEHFGNWICFNFQVTSSSRPFYMTRQTVTLVIKLCSVWDYRWWTLTFILPVCLVAVCRDRFTFTRW
jgi:hypothetical protein